jgi:5'-3' exonuclease
MLALIDGDILVYRVGFAAQQKGPDGEPQALPKGIALARMRDTLTNIADKTRADASTIYLTASGKSNFRFALFPEYKANRKSPKPLLYDQLREYLVSTHGANVVEGQEADDQIGIDSQLNKDCIICSIDKDLDQIPGKHYNFVKDLHYEVTPEAGLKFFYQQLLQGDMTDNISGIYGIGPAKAVAALAKATTERHLFQVARSMYQKHYPEDWEKRLLLNGRLLKIRQVENELWDMPVLDETDEQPTNVPA